MKHVLSNIPATLGRPFKVREKIGRPGQLILGAIPIAALLLLWIVLTRGEYENRIVPPLILPSPFEVAGSLRSLWFEAELSRSIVASGFRVICGFLIGLVVAFPLGLFMGSIAKIKAMFNPLMTFAAYLPIPALLPLTMSFFGIGELQKVMFLGLAFVIYLLPLFVKAVDDVDNVYLQTAYTLGATKWQTIRRVLFEISMPRVFHAMRLGFGVGWTYIILAEMVAADRGLGQIIIIAQRRGPREHIYLVLLVIVLIAYLTDKLWVRATRSLFPYLEER